MCILCVFYVCCHWRNNKWMNEWINFWMSSHCASPVRRSLYALCRRQPSAITSSKTINTIGSRPYTHFPNFRGFFSEFWGFSNLTPGFSSELAQLNRFFSNFACRQNIRRTSQNARKSWESPTPSHPVSRNVYAVLSSSVESFPVHWLMSSAVFTPNFSIFQKNLLIQDMAQKVLCVCGSGFRVPIPPPPSIRVFEIWPGSIMRGHKTGGRLDQNWGLCPRAPA